MEWIDITIRLPKEGEQVMLYRRHHNRLGRERKFRMMTGYYVKSANVNGKSRPVWRAVPSTSYVEGVVAWAPMPIEPDFELLTAE